MDGPDRPESRFLARGARAAPVAIALALAAGGLVLRYLVLRSAAGQLNADEAYTGVQAMEILHGDLPVTVNANAYTAVFESYLLAPILAVFGAGVIVLKGMAIALWAGAAVALYVAARHLMRTGAAVVAAALFWLTSGGLLVISTVAYAGYASGLALCIASLMLAVTLKDDPRPTPRAVLCGVAIGLALWAHPMFVAVLGPMSAVTLYECRRRIRAVWLPAAAGAVAALLPWLVWNATSGWPAIHEQPSLPGTYRDRITAFAEVLFPRAFGLRDRSLHWIPVNQGFAVAIFSVIVVAVVAGAVLMARDGRWQVPAMLALALPLMALFPALIYVDDARYAIIVFPFACIAIGRACAGLAQIRVRGHGGIVPVGVVVVAAWLAACVVPHLRALPPAPGGHPNAALESLVGRLRAEGHDRIEGSYWAVHPIVYLSDGKILGAVCRAYVVRVPRQQRIVERTSPADLVWVFMSYDEDRIAPGCLAPRVDYRRTALGLQVLYTPVGPKPGA